MDRHRRDAVRLEISRLAAERFIAQGVAASTVEEIAGDSGIATRTFYRYFNTKEEAVLPLLDRGIRAWLSRLRACPAELDLGTALRYAIDETAAELYGCTPEELRLMQRLIRCMRTDADLRAVWLERHAQCEELMAVVVAERQRAEPESLAVRGIAAAVNAAIRVALEVWAEVEPGEPPTVQALQALATLDGARALHATPAEPAPG